MKKSWQDLLSQEKTTNKRVTISEVKACSFGAGFFLGIKKARSVRTGFLMQINAPSTLLMIITFIASPHFL